MKSANIQIPGMLRPMAALVLAAVALLLPQRAAAQYDAQFSQYFEVPNYYNAGAIGNTDF